MLPESRYCVHYKGRGIRIYRLAAGGNQGPHRLPGYGEPAFYRTGAIRPFQPRYRPGAGTIEKRAGRVLPGRQETFARRLAGLAGGDHIPTNGLESRPFHRLGEGKDLRLGSPEDRPARCGQGGGCGLGKKPVFTGGTLSPGGGRQRHPGRIQRRIKDKKMVVKA